jgi:hypothetical protein
VVYKTPASKYYVLTRKWVWDLVEPDEIIFRDDPRMWCERCTLNECEDLFHLLWKCPESQAVWEWVFTLMRKVCKFRATDWSFTVAQALLGAPVDNGGSRWPMILWEVIRGHTVWELWYGRDRLMFDASPTSRYGIVMLIWSQTRQYFLMGWNGYKEKILSGKLSQAEAWRLSTRDYGHDECLFSLDKETLRVPYSLFGVL